MTACRAFMRRPMPLRVCFVCSLNASRKQVHLGLPMCSEYSSQKRVHLGLRYPMRRHATRCRVLLDGYGRLRDRTSPRVAGPPVRVDHRLPDGVPERPGVRVVLQEAQELAGQARLLELVGRAALLRERASETARGCPPPHTQSASKPIECHVACCRPSCYRTSCQAQQVLGDRWLGRVLFGVPGCPSPSS